MELVEELKERKSKAEGSETMNELSVMLKAGIGP